MALTSDEANLINDLSRRHDAEIPELESYDRYYEGTQPLTYMHPEVLREVDDRIKPVIVFWPQLTADSIAERLRLDSFRTGDKGLDAELTRVWLANEMNLGMRQATVDSLVMRRSYICVGTNEQDPLTPLVTPESALEVYADTDPRTRRVRAALRRVNDTDSAGSVSARYATLYLPNETIWCHYEGGWKEDNRDQHGLGMVPVVPLVNRPRLRSTTRTPRNTTIERIGRSELDAVIPLSDAVCKLATDMMVAGEFVAIPLRALFGVGPEAFVDAEGNPVTALQAMLGRALAIDSEGVKAFEFAAAQLSNFTNGIRELAQLVMSVTGLPPHYLGQASTNPTSAEAITGSESRLALRAEDKQDSLGVGAVRVARLIRRFQTGNWPEQTIRCDWRNVRTPTIAQQADAAVKLFTTAPEPIVPLRQTREALGYTDEDIKVMEAEDERRREASPVAAIARGLADQRVTPVDDDAAA